MSKTDQQQTRDEYLKVRLTKAMYTIRLFKSVSTQANYKEFKVIADSTGEALQRVLDTIDFHNTTIFQLQVIDMTDLEDIIR